MWGNNAYAFAGADETSVKEGMKYYDADGNLQREIPDEDVPEPAVESVVSRFEKGTVFTVVPGEIDGRKSKITAGQTDRAPFYHCV